MSSFYSKILYSLCIVLLFPACRKSNDEPEPEPVANRTILVYMGGDNNLGMETYDKLIEISKGWDSTFDGNILIYQDTPWKDCPRLIKITGFDGVDPKYDVVKKYDISNSASPTVFRQAITDAFKDSPASSYGLIVFSHASGWLPPHTLSNPNYTPSSTRSVIIDDTDEMDIKDFASALPDKLFDFIIFEACNMANIEVAYEMKDKAEYIVASSAPIVSPGFTRIYSGSLKYLFEKNANLSAFAKSYFDLWNSYSGAKQSATISIAKVSELPALVDAVRSIKQNTSNNIDISDLQTYDGVLNSPYYFFDFRSYYNLLANESQMQALDNAIGKCIVYKAQTSNYATSEGVFPINSHCGITTYIEQGALSSINEEYRKLKWYNAIKVD